MTGLGQARILKEVVGNIYAQWDEIISDTYLSRVLLLRQLCKRQLFRQIVDC